MDPLGIFLNDERNWAYGPIYQWNNSVLNGDLLNRPDEIGYLLTTY